MSFIMSQQFIKTAIENVNKDQKCIDLHANSCDHYAGLSAINAIKSFHFIQLLFQAKKLKKNPKQVLSKFLIGYLKSLLFAGGSLYIIRRFICLVTQFYKFSTTAIIVSGLASGIPLLIESKGRQTQISLFCLKEGLDMTYLILRRRYPSLYVQNGQILIFSISIAIILYQYFQKNSNIRESYKKILGFLFHNI